MLEKTKKDFDLISRHYATSRVFPQESVKKLIDLCQKGEKVLDAGCAHGYLYPFFEKKGVEYFGVDFSENLIKIAKEKYPKGNFFVADILNLPFSDNFFDKVFSISVLHHIPSKKLRQKAFEEVKRVLKPQGLFIVRVWNVLNFFEGRLAFLKYSFLKIFKKTELDFFDVFVPWKDSQGKVLVQRYYHCFTKRELKNLAKKTGFLILKLWEEGKGKESNLFLIAKNIKIKK